MSAGLRVTLMPHSSITASFSCAVPLPPEMIAPACPMRFPGGAVTPAMNPTTGFFMLSLTQPEPVFHQLADRLVRQRSRPRHDADGSLLVDVARHDADLDLIGRDDARAVG